MKHHTKQKSTLISKSNKLEYLKELFFPVLSDINAIEKETSNSAWELASDEEEYSKIISLISKNRASGKSQHEFIVIK